MIGLGQEKLSSFVFHRCMIFKSGLETLIWPVKHKRSMIGEAPRIDYPP